MAQDEPQATPPLPPQMLGPDGKPCKACKNASLMLTAFSEMRRAFSSEPTPQPSPPAAPGREHSSASTDGTSPNDTPTVTVSSPVAADAQPSTSCPPEGDEIGRAGWTFLHTMAAYYPENPTEQQQTYMKQFVRAVGEFYPCQVCAEHFRDEARKEPPDVTNNSTISQWFCRMHNKVNEVLGKPVFDCSRVLERWKDGPADGSCD